MFRATLVSSAVPVIGDKRVNSDSGKVLIVWKGESRERVALINMLRDLAFEVIEFDPQVDLSQHPVPEPLLNVGTLVVSAMALTPTALSNISRTPVGTIIAVLKRGQRADFPPESVDAVIQWPDDIDNFGHSLREAMRTDLDIPPAAEVFLEQTMLGYSAPFLGAIDQLRQYSETEAPLLISGETGTGKELAATAAHTLGPRCHGAFVPVNCGAFVEELIQSELFGHVRGAFTDAKTNHTGLVEQAIGGTLFLDEIETLSAKAQVSLLRFLDTNEYCPVGGQGIQHADVRIIAATNQPLVDLVASGQFRSDLYYRLNVLSIELPALRERGADAIVLANSFVHRFAARYEKACTVIDGPSERRICTYRWPGNARELQNVVHRAVVVARASDEVIPLSQLESGSLNQDGAQLVELHDGLMNLPFGEAKAQLLDTFERRYLTERLRDSHGNVSKAALRAGKHRRAFDKLLEKYSIDKSQYR